MYVLKEMSDEKLQSILKRWMKITYYKYFVCYDMCIKQVF